MILDISTAEDGRWFTFFYSRLDPNTLEPVYDDPIENGPRMKIRNPTPLWRERNEKKKKRKEYVLNPKTRGMDVVESDVELTAAQKKAENEEFVDYVIQESEQFTLNGKEIKGTLQEKVKMMENPLISMFVQRCIQILQESGVQEAEAQPKNSLTGSSSLMTVLDPE